ncbi:MAG: VOC family protein [Actinomycetota bacterium]
MTDRNTGPRLSLSHSTMAVDDLDRMLAFYCDVLGFRVTNRGEVGDGAEMAFVSQDPGDHHQIVFVSGTPTGEPGFSLTDHLAFRTDTLDSLRAIGVALAEAGVDDIIPISHGNAWSLYFTDPEGNGLECFVDTPFHVAQPHAGGLDLDQSDADIEATTRAEIESLPEFAPMERWKAEFEAALAASGRHD